MNPDRPPALICDKAAERQGNQWAKEAPKNHPVKVKVGHRVNVEGRTNLQHQGSREHHEESHLTTSTILVLVMLSMVNPW